MLTVICFGSMFSTNVPALESFASMCGMNGSHCVPAGVLPESSGWSAGGRKKTTKKTAAKKSARARTRAMVPDRIFSPKNLRITKNGEKGILFFRGHAKKNQKKFGLK